MICSIILISLGDSVPVDIEAVSVALSIKNSCYAPRKVKLSFEFSSCGRRFVLLHVGVTWCLFERKKMGNSDMVTLSKIILIQWLIFSYFYTIRSTVSRVSHSVVVYKCH